MRLRRRAAVIAAAVLGAVACAATGPDFKTENIAKGLTPQKASAQGDTAAGQRVLWGGVIVTTTNLPDTTQIEVIGYPLDRDQAPKSGETPLGRFLVVEQGYLETADYSAGREITVIGSISDTRAGMIGQSSYTYPVVDPERTHLWPEDTQQPYASPNVHLGVGVGVIFD